MVTRRDRVRRLANTAATLLVLAVALMATYAFSTMLALPMLALAELLLETNKLAGAAMGIAALAVSLVIPLYVGLGATRTLSRIVPLGVSGTPPRTEVKLVAFGALGAAILGWFLVDVALDVYYGRPSDNWLFVWPASVVGIVLAVSIVVVRRRHRRSFAATDAPFVLFLRRFSSYSDRIALGECLKACPAGTPLALLVPVAPKVRDWNPISLAFSGFKLRQPVRSLPLFFRTEDALWEQAARALIAKADRIVFDVSDHSASIALESAMITEASQWARVVVLIDGSKQAREPTEPERRAGRVVVYGRVWMSRWLWSGLIASAIAAGGTATLIRELGQRVLPLALWDAIDSQLFAALVTFGSWAAFYFVFFFRPAMDKNGSRRLREAMAAPVPTLARPDVPDTLRVAPRDDMLSLTD